MILVCIDIYQGTLNPTAPHLLAFLARPTPVQDGISLFVGAYSCSFYIVSKTACDIEILVNLAILPINLKISTLCCLIAEHIQIRPHRFGGEGMLIGVQIATLNAQWHLLI